MRWPAVGLDAQHIEMAGDPLSGSRIDSLVCEGSIRRRPVLMHGSPPGCASDLTDQPAPDQLSQNNQSEYAHQQPADQAAVR